MRGLTLVTGSEGLVGSRFIELFPHKNFLHYPKQVEFDITDKPQVKELIDSYNFSAVIHFAAFTDVGEAEKQRDQKDGSCWQVNVEGTRNLVEVIAPKKTKTHFIQVSTDMVFSGSESDPGPYSEDHPPEENKDNLSWYGYTKAEAERIVRDALGENYSILRLIYPVRSHFAGKLDYLRKLLKLYDEGKLYPLFSDQKISITFIDEACEALNKMVNEVHYGVYHAASKDTTTPYEIFSYLLEEARGVKGVIEKTTLEEFLAKTGDYPFRYLKHGGLSVDKTEQNLGLKFRTWRQIVDKLVSQGLGK